MSKKKVKKAAIKKASKSVDEGFIKELEGFGLSVLSNENDNTEIAPYIIPLRHKGLHKTTGGIIGSKFVEISGDSMSGKSYLLYEIEAETINMDGYVLHFDGERALEDRYAKMVGLDMHSGRFVLGEKQTEVQKRKGQRGDAIIDIDEFFKLAGKFIRLVRKKVKDLSIPIVIGCDSFPALQCKIDMENIEAGKDPRGYMAMQKNAKFSQWIEKFIPILDKNGATFVLLNQTRIDRSGYIPKTSTLCETVIKFWATQRIQGKLTKRLTKKVKSLEVKTGVTIQVGMTTQWKTIKNRAVKPFQTVITRILYSKGIDPWSGLDELLVNEGLIKPGTTSSIETVKAGVSKRVFDELKLNKDGTKLAKPFSGFKLEDETDTKFYCTLKELCKAHPNFLKPLWTELDEDEEELIEETIGGNE